MSLNAYWEAHPPVHLLVAAFMGHKPKAAGKLDDLIQMFEDGVVK